MSEGKKTCFDESKLSDDDDVAGGDDGGKESLRNRIGINRLTIVEVKSERRKNKQKVVNE